VTSLKKAECKARYLYERIYCARGDMENRIKECQIDLFADRTSTATMRPNQLRQAARGNHPFLLRFQFFGHTGNGKRYCAISIACNTSVSAIGSRLAGAHRCRQIDRSAIPPRPYRVAAAP
jgi:hypothetical protein